LKKQIAILLGLMAFGVASDANAQVSIYYGPGLYGRYYQPGLPPGEAVRVVRSAGFIPLSAPLRRGPNYVIIAEGRQHEQVRVVVNAYGGGIVMVRPVLAALGPPGPYAAPPAYVGPPPAYVTPPPAYVGPPPHGPNVAGRADEPIAPEYLPPGEVPNVDRSGPVPPPHSPNSRIATAPAAVPPPNVPARTPVPRPRPKVAATATAPAAPAAAATPAAPAAASTTTEVPEAPPMPTRRETTPLAPVVPLD
jgi:hypothetical protein